MGPRVCLLLATLSIALSLTPFALGNADPIGGFCLHTQSFSRPMTIVRPILHIVCHIPRYRKRDMRGSGGGACKCIQHPLLYSVRVCCLAASVVTPWGYENKRLPLRTLTSPRTISHHLPVILLVPKERERKERGKREKRLGIELP
jgi:hypothetical protein